MCDKVASGSKEFPGNDERYFNIPRTYTVLPLIMATLFNNSDSRVRVQIEVYNLLLLARGALFEGRIPIRGIFGRGRFGSKAGLAWLHTALITKVRRRPAINGDCT